MRGILSAKFTQNLPMARTLLATRDAELWHGDVDIPNGLISRKNIVAKNAPLILQHGSKITPTMRENMVNLADEDARNLISE